MSIANAKHGSAIEPRAAQDTAPSVPAHRPAPGLHQDQGPLLAQIPDLDPKATPKVPEKRFDGRIISQALSFKLIFGVGLGLVIGAILPFIFGKASRPGSEVNELPAWHSNGGSRGTIDNTSQTLAPRWPSSPTTTSAQQTPPAILMPQRPQVGDTRPVALSEPAWPSSRSSIAPPPAGTPLPAANNYINPSMTGVNPPAVRGDYRGLDRPADPRNLQADNRNDPAAANRNNDTRYNYLPNSLEATVRRDASAFDNAVRRDVSGVDNAVRRDVSAVDNALRRDAQPSIYPRDPRFDNNYPPAAGSNSPLMPSGIPGSTSNYRDPQTSEPGVARFDGTINTPPARTSYDRAGSSNN